MIYNVPVRDMTGAHKKSITVSIKFINFIQEHHNQQYIDHQHHQHHIGHHHHYQPEWDPNDPDSRTSEVGNAIGLCNENKYICAPALPLSIVKNKKE